MSTYFATLTPDEQEAECRKYILGIRVIPLTSGNFALYNPHFKLISIVSTLDPTFFQLYTSNQAEKYKKDAKAKTKLSATDLLKELGL